MNMRRFGVAASVVAMVATAAGSSRLHATHVRPQQARGPHATGSSLARQLPRGFILPSADRDLTVSSLITTDFDADGDLDIVAADRSNGAIGIVVWVNDGAGRLTRKAPVSGGTLAGEPASPTLDERQATVMASVQPDGPAITAVSANAWLTLPARRHDTARAAVPESLNPSSLRSRSPPLHS